MKTIDISGFGGSYEETCQKMVTAGLRFLSDKMSFDWNSYVQFQNIIGVTIAEGDDARALNQILIHSAGEAGCTGAMHQAVVNHLHYISQHSYREWIDEGQRRNSTYEIDDPEREALVKSIERPE